MFEYDDYTLSILQCVCEKVKTSSQNNMYIKQVCIVQHSDSLKSEKQRETLKTVM